MRPGAAFFACALGMGTLFDSSSSFAGDAAPAEPNEQDAKTLEARRHFKAGVKLYQDGTYAAALAEFESAYENKPSPGSLQNVALCQKALLRYAEATDTLRRLLERHGAELSEEEKTAARTALQELEASVGSVVVSVRPSHAKVTLDGRPLDSASLGAPFRLNVGEHTFSADAPGFSRVSKLVRVAAGSRDVPVELALTPVMGFLDVVANDPSAVIAIDGRPLSIGSFSGPVAPNEEHLVQVYRPGFEPFETRVTVDVGETEVVTGTLGERVEGAATTPDKGPLPPPPREKQKLGWYSMAGLDLLGRGPAPLDFDDDVAGASGGAIAVNLRIGRRMFPTLGAELLFDAGSLNVENVCDEGRHGDLPAPPCESQDQVTRNYQMGWFRFGPLLRFSTPTKGWRGGAGLGGGLVWHTLSVAEVEGRSADVSLDGGKAKGWDAFFKAELGVAYHFGHLSVGLDLLAEIDGARSLEGTFDGKHRSAFVESGNALPMLGIGLRAGYSQFPAEKP
jgi:hypothetical protein